MSVSILSVFKNRFYFQYSRNFCLKTSTIFALSSGYGKCGVAVIRVSGPESGSALKALTKLKILPKPRTALLRNIYNPTNDEILDKGLILWFPAPNSFTGEDCCEFQVHGSIAVVSAVLKSLVTVDSLRQAEAGEFTRRAFYSGKLDLTEVEGLADLLQAETELQRKQAFFQTVGVLGKLYNKWRIILIKSLANIEAHIDFEETESLENNLLTEMINNVQNLYEEIFRHLQDGRRGEILRSGVKTVIIGETNVGKSSLLNALCQKPSAIVTPIKGTTRDLLEVSLDLNGYPLILTDTAGLRKYTSDIIEKEGIRRAIKSLKTADLVIFVIDVKTFVNWAQKNEQSFSEYLQYYMNLMQVRDKDWFQKEHVFVLNKSDLVNRTEKILVSRVLDENRKTILLSCKTEDGMKNFIDAITDHLKKICGEPSMEHPCMNQERHRNLLICCATHLNRFLQKIETDHFDVVLMAQDLRLAVRQLGKLTGQVTTEELLDVIFKDFCVGK